MTLAYGGNPATLINGVIYERAERQNSGGHGEVSPIYGTNSHLDAGNNILSINGPESVDIAYLGPQIPFFLQATILDSTVSPPVERVAQYDMGPSNYSQSISVPTGQSLIKLRALRRF